MYVRIISLFLALGMFVSFPIAAQEQEQKEVCAKLLDWLYKDLTLQNLDRSFKRTKTKLFMGMLKTLENVQGVNLKYHPELLKLWKSLSKIDPKFEGYLKKNSPYNRYRFWRGRTYTKINTYSFHDAIKAWKDLQVSNPEYFKGLEQNELLDKWDLVTADVVDNVSDIKYQNTGVKTKLEYISKQLKEASTNPSKKLTTKANLSELKEKMDSLEKDIYNNSSDLYKEYLNDYGHVCSEEDISKLDPLQMEDYFCLDCADPNPNISPLLLGLADVVTIKDLNMIEQPEIPVIIPPDTRDEVDKLEVTKINYDVNPDPKATYCLRDPNVIDTLIIHHTGEEKDVGPELINQGHVGRSTDGDPWYMIGYNYIVSEQHHGATADSPTVIQGRPPEMRGAHAGGYTRKLSKERRDELSEYKIKCGRDDKFIETNMSAEFKYKRISGNITSLGIAVLGNYETKYTSTVGGVTLIKNVSGSKKFKFPSDIILTKVAQLACKIQRQYPNVKRLVPHSYFKATNCPGSIIAKLQTITNLANSYEGCNFNDPEYMR